MIKSSIANLVSYPRAGIEAKAAGRLLHGGHLYLTRVRELKLLLIKHCCFKHIYLYLTRVRELKRKTPDCPPALSACPLYLTRVRELKLQVGELTTIKTYNLYLTRVRELKQPSVLNDRRLFFITIFSLRKLQRGTFSGKIYTEAEEQIQKATG